VRRNPDPAVSTVLAVQSLCHINGALKLRHQKLGFSCVYIAQVSQLAATRWPRLRRYAGKCRMLAKNLAFDTHGLRNRSVTGSYFAIPFRRCDGNPGVGEATAGWWQTKFTNQAAMKTPSKAFGRFSAASEQA